MNNKREKHFAHAQGYGTFFANISFSPQSLPGLFRIVFFLFSFLSSKSFHRVCTLPILYYTIESVYFIPNYEKQSIPALTFAIEIGK